MKFRFPIIIIDEDFRSENASGLGIRALAQAIENEGMEILGVTSYGDLTSFAQQQSLASAFLLSIDDEEFGGLFQKPAGWVDIAGVPNEKKSCYQLKRITADFPGVHALAFNELAKL